MIRSLQLFVSVLILAVLVVIGQALLAIEKDTHTVTDRRYLDCVASPAGDELLCKQVTLTDPAYKP